MAGQAVPGWWGLEWRADSSILARRPCRRRWWSLAGPYHPRCCVKAYFRWLGLPTFVLGLQGGAGANLDSWHLRGSFAFLLAVLFCGKRSFCRLPVTPAVLFVLRFLLRRSLQSGCVWPVGPWAEGLAMVSGVLFTYLFIFLLFLFFFAIWFRFRNVVGACLATPFVLLVDPRGPFRIASGRPSLVTSHLSPPFSSLSLNAGGAGLGVR